MNLLKQYFHVIQTVQIPVSANFVWKLLEDFYQVHKWHPQILVSEMDNEQNVFKRRVIFQNEMIDTIEQLEHYDQQKREYYYKNIGGNTYLNKTFLNKQGRLNLSIYWRQEYNINASTLWKLVGV